MGITKSGGQKDALDRFYTKISIAQFCISKCNLTSYDLIIEPSAGSGTFSNQILGCLAYDIEPDEKAINITKTNWFDVDKTQFSSNSLVIGNPPFGVQGKLAIQFFNEAAKFARTIAFILPPSFRKLSIQNKLDLHFELVKDISLPKDSFIFNGSAYNLPCVFQIWERISNNNIRGKYVPKLTTELFTFCAPDIADFRIQRVGGNAGKAYRDKNGAISSNYYIKNGNIMSANELINIINAITFPTLEFTCGPKSLSKGELIEELEKVINI